MFFISESNIKSLYFNFNSNTTQAHGYISSTQICPLFSPKTHQQNNFLSSFDTKIEIAALKRIPIPCGENGRREAGEQNGRKGVPKENP